jgi:hypothetical protein
MENKQIEERLYIPASIDDAYEHFPAVGRKVKISSRKGRGEKNEERITVKGVVIQKVKHERGAHFSIIKMPYRNKRGQYRMSFQFVDIITGRIIVETVIELEKGGAR